MPKISLIIPVYNVELYIESCLISALEQTYQDIEVILVDDCGNDKSMEIIADIIKKHPNGNKASIVTHEKNRGLSGARNTGIRACTGEYLYFFDSDDEIDLRTIEVMLKQVDKYNNPDFVIGGYCTLDNPTALVAELRLTDGLLNGNDVILKSFVSHEWYVMAWNKLVNRSFLIRNNLFFEEGLIHEDLVWSLMLACKANTMAVVNYITYKYRIRKGSITAEKSRKSGDHYLKGLDLVMKYVLEHNFVNAHTYEYLENMKKDMFIGTLHYYTPTEKMEAYKRFKTYRSHYPAVSLSFKKTIRDLHYYFGTKIGFYIYLLYAKMVHYNAKSI